MILETQSIFMYGIEDLMTLYSLSLKIFRDHYLHEDPFHMHIPIPLSCRHVDVYEPYDEIFYYYDVNSLYPCDGELSYA